MATRKTLILNAAQIQQKIDRIAYQIYEHNFDEKELIIAGIASRGFIIAKRIAQKLKQISDIKITLTEVVVNKDNPLDSTVKHGLTEKDFKGKAIILVDDVLKSGKTLIYGLEPFLKVPVKRITTVVLVDRNHNRYPIKADFVGLSLATTLQEHISVEVDKKGDEAVYLL